MRAFAPLVLLGLLGCADLIGLRGYQDRPDAGAGGMAAGGDGGIGGIGGDPSTGGMGTAAAGPCLTSYRDCVFDDGPVAYFRLAETTVNSQPLDEMMSVDAQYVEVPMKGTLTFGLPSLVGDPRDAAVRFQNSGNTPEAVLEVESGSLLSFPGVTAFSLEVWQYQPRDDDPDIVDKLVGKSNGTDTDGYYLGQRGDNYVFRRCRGDAPDGCDQAASAPVLDGATVHLVATYDGLTMALYVNGALADTEASSRALLNIGETFKVGNTTEDATLDEVAVYGYALSAEQVHDHYALGAGR